MPDPAESTTPKAKKRASSRKPREKGFNRHKLRHWTAEQISAVHRALEETKGNLSMTSEILGVPVATLHQALTKIESLRIRWRPDAPAEKPHTAVINPESQDVDPAELIAAVDEQSDLIRRRKFEELGFGREHTEMMERLEKIHRSSVVNMAGLAQAGLAKAAIDLITLHDRYNQRLVNGTIPEDFKGIDGDGNPIYVQDERGWLETMKNITAEIRQLDKQVQSDRHTALLIEEKKQQIREKNRGAPKATPGFATTVKQNT